jgi:hypothetical protein
MQIKLQSLKQLSSKNARNSKGSIVRSVPNNVSDFTLDVSKKPDTLQQYDAEESFLKESHITKFKMQWSDNAEKFVSNILSILSKHYAFTDALDRVEELLLDPSQGGPIDPRASLRSEHFDKEMLSLLEMRVTQEYVNSQYSEEDAKAIFEYILNPNPTKKHNPDNDVDENNVTNWVRKLKDSLDKTKKSLDNTQSEVKDLAVKKSLQRAPKT